MLRATASLLAFLLVSLACGQAARAQPTRIADIVPGFFGSQPEGFVGAGGLVFFRASTPATGEEVWQTDGTAQGTVLVADIRSGSGDSQPNHNGRFLVPLDDAMFFSASDGFHGTKLYRTQGAGGGAVLVRQDGPLSPGKPVEFDGVLYFSAYDALGAEPWRSDGTEAGTFQLLDVGYDTASSYPRNFTAFNQALFFTAHRDGLGTEIWRSDGTSSGTALFVDLQPGEGFGVTGPLSVYGDVLLFVGDDGVSGHELWRTGGVPGSTALVKDINPGIESSGPGGFTTMGDASYFKASTPNEGSELWRTDGTEAGTVLVKDIWPGPTSSGSGDLIALEDLIIFHADDGETGQELWRSDGTPEGTYRIRDLTPGASDSFKGGYTEIIRFGDAVFFSAITEDGLGLWRTDGSSEGTQLVWQGEAYFLAVVGDTLYFSGDDGESGLEPWALGPVDIQSVAPLSPNVLRLEATPNPARDRLEALVSFEGSPEAHVTVTVYDTLGRHLSRLWRGPALAGGHRMELDVSDLAPGVYVLRAEASGQTAHRLVTVRP